MAKLYNPFYENSYGICIGVDKYTHLQPLENCVAGAKEISKILNNQGYDVNELFDEMATSIKIKNALEDLSHKTQENDRVFVYFAGHGLRRKTISQEDVGLLAAFDTEKNYSNSIYFQEITRALQFVKAKHIFITLDACFSGLALVRHDILGEDHENDAQIIADNFKRRRAMEILTAGGQSEYAYDRFPYNGPAGLSPFTYFLSLGMRGEGVQKSLDKLVTGRSLANYVRNNVQQFAPGQIPQYGIVPGSDSEGEYVFLEKSKGTSIPENERLHPGAKQVPEHRQTADITDRIRELYDENWILYKDFLVQLENIVGRRPEGSHLRILKDHYIFNHLGFKLEQDEFNAYTLLLDSSYENIEIESSKTRLKLYFRRVKNVLDRFPLMGLDPNQLSQWRDCVDGVIADLGSKEDDALVIRRVEEFAKSTLALTRFTTTAHDPELKAALYLIKKIDFADKGGSQKVERFLVDKIQKELEDSIDVSSKNLFTEYLDDESNFWWGLLVLMDHSMDDFKLHDFRGLTGVEQILDRLITKDRVVTAGYGAARKEIVFEIHSEYETILWINNLGFLIAQLLERKGIQDLPSRIRQYTLGLLEPYLFDDKIRPKGSLFFWALELEVWGRIIAWTKGLVKDHVGRDIRSQENNKIYR